MNVRHFRHRVLSRKNNGIQLTAISFRLSADITPRLKQAAES